MKAQNGFGKRVALVRRDAKLSMTAFAQKALSPNASAKNIGRIESEEVTPRANTLVKIAEAGGVSLEWLATGQCTLKPSTIVRTAGVGERITKARLAKGMTCLGLARGLRALLCAVTLVRRLAQAFWTGSASECTSESSISPRMRRR